MKVLAFYLPQFHTIPENNEWWGDGFTEWTNTKKAKPLFKEHYQPREPYNSNYYDLSDIDTMRWQADLAKEYGIYGFCYYHYWFKGKKLLEKPLENMLKHKEIDLPFCFSWANEPWSRTWDGRDSEVLMPQEYGDKSDWKKHFEYLIDFFKDDRYIKIDNKPLMVIYKTMHIPDGDKMCQYWNDLAIQEGFDGLYFVETLGGMQASPSLKISDAVVELEPNFTMAGHQTSFFERQLRKIKKKITGLQLYDYDRVWKKIIARKSNRFEKKHFLGAFIDWDNSPRKGNNGVIFKGASPDKFNKYLSIQIDKSEKNSFLFINAWNEWAEGTYLEPDMKYEYQYLTALKNAIDKT